MFYLRNKCDSDLDDWVTVNQVAELSLPSKTVDIVNCTTLPSLEVNENVLSPVIPDSGDDVDHSSLSKNVVIQSSSSDVYALSSLWVYFCFRLIID